MFLTEEEEVISSDVAVEDAGLSVHVMESDTSTTRPAQNLHCPPSQLVIRLKELVLEMKRQEYQTQLLRVRALEIDADKAFKNVPVSVTGWAFG